MRILTTDRPGNLTELARRLFEIDGPRAAAIEKKAIAALRRANPNLRSNAVLPAGTALAVPELEGVKPRRTAPPNAAAPTLSADHLAAVLEKAGALLTAASAAQQAQDKTALGLIDRHAGEFKDAGREVGERLEKARQATNARMKARSAATKVRQEQLKTLQKDLEVLLKGLAR